MDCPKCGKEMERANKIMICGTETGPGYVCKHCLSIKFDKEYKVGNINIIMAGSGNMYKKFNQEGKEPIWVWEFTEDMICMSQNILAPEEQGDMEPDWLIIDKKILKQISDSFPVTK